VASTKLLLLVALTAIALAVGFSSDIQSGLLHTLDPLLNPKPVQEYATSARAKVGQNIVVKGRVVDIIMSYDASGASKALVVEIDKDNPLSQQYSVMIVIVPDAEIQDRVVEGSVVKTVGTIIYISKENHVIYIRADNISVVEKTSRGHSEETISGIN
jgi:hypothetical protein